MDDSIKMSVSPVLSKDGQRYAFVSFEDGERVAEGRIPECKLVSNKGFSEEEAARLEEYMKEELAQLKRMAASIRVIDAFMK